MKEWIITHIKGKEVIKADWRDEVRECARKMKLDVISIRNVDNYKHVNGKLS